MEPRKRSTHSQGATLPTTRQDTTTTRQRSPRSKRRTSSRKGAARSSMLLIRYLGGFFLAVVILLYVLATRHVVLYSSRETQKNDPAGASQANSNNGNDNRRTLSQPVQIESFKIGDINNNIVTNLIKKPRTIGYFYGDQVSASFVGIDHKYLPLHDNRIHKIHRQTIMREEDMERQEDLLNSKDYRGGKADTVKDMGKDCVAQYPWQESFHPTCNTIMELDMTHFSTKRRHHHDEESDDSEDDPEPPEAFDFLANGYWRDVWKVTDINPGQEEPDLLIFKTQRYEHDFEPRNWDRHRRDAVAMDELTGSKHIMDIYGFCGSASIDEFADGGDLNAALWPDEDDVVPWSPQERLVVGYQVVQALAAVHNYPKEGVAAIAHTDIQLGQYVYVTKVGGFKLQDFNRARFLAWNEVTDEPCTYEVGNNPGGFRSPEEYAYDYQTEKVDIYSMGNILYCILTLLYPFEHVKEKVIYKNVMNGERPEIPPEILNSTDPYDQTMLKAIEMSWIQDPGERASARQVQELMLAALKRLDVKPDASL